MYVYILDNKPNGELYKKVNKELSDFLIGFKEDFELEDFGATYTSTFTKDKESVMLSNDYCIEKLWIKSTIELPQFKKFLSNLETVRNRYWKYNYILEEDELYEKVTVRKFRTTEFWFSSSSIWIIRNFRIITSDGKLYNVKHYNLLKSY